jgi:translocator protein
MRFLSLPLFIAVVLGIGLLLGYATAPGEWYASLQKPPFNPPNWLFGPVWSVLYVLIAIAGWRVFERDGTGSLKKLWFAQMALNFLWTPIFFGAQQIGLALIVMIALLAAILAFIALAWRRDLAAALLFVPYAVWVGFATLLNGSIWMLN